MRPAQFEVLAAVGCGSGGFVQEPVFDEDDGVGVAYGGAEQAVGVGGGGGHDDFEAGDGREQAFQAL